MLATNRENHEDPNFDNKKLAHPVGDTFEGKRCNCHQVQLSGNEVCSVLESHQIRTKGTEPPFRKKGKSFIAKVAVVLPGPCCPYLWPPQQLEDGDSTVGRACPSQEG